MQAIKFIWFPIAKSIVLIHEHATCFVFFGWLEEKQNIIFRLFLHQFIEQTKGNRHVDIVSTSVHAPFVLARKRQPCFFNNRQSVNICTPTNCFFRGISLDKDKNTCTPSALFYKVFSSRYLCNPLQKIGLCFEFFQTNFWNLMQIATNFH